METNAPRKVLRQRIFGSPILGSTVLLVALIGSHACMKSDCADTDSCGAFSPSAGCGWRLDDNSVVFSTDALEARGATWSESTGWTLPNGSHPRFLCDLPTSDAGINGSSGTTGNQDSGNSGASNGGTQGGNSGSGSGGQSGTGGAGGGTGGSGGVDTDGGSNGVVCTDTLETGCTPAQQNAVFVDASAADGGDGSLASPLNSIVDAFTAAKTNAATDIYVCAGNYDESVVITDNEAGIDLHGGFNCNGFTYDASIPVVSRSTGGYSLYIDSLNSPILIEDLAFTAIDATNPGESSIAAFISASTSVTLDRCQFTAGAGVTGDDGVTEAFVEGNTAGVNWPVLSTLVGNDGGDTNGGVAKPIMCPAGDTNFGGTGGSQLPEDGTSGGPGGRGGAAGQAISMCSSGGGGGDGESGPDGQDGEGALIGALNAAGFSPGSGGDGTAGETGGGGGGGAGKSSSGGNGGGGGGGGGCGGNFGPGGQGGGASIALLSYSSIVVIRGSSLTSANAGDGGLGDVGQDGQHLDGSALLASIGGGGPNAACDGGGGGAGGNGGGGAGGAGGISVGVLWSGTTAPVLDQVTTDAITVGLEGGAGAGGGTASDGAAGFAEAVHEL